MTATPTIQKKSPFPISSILFFLYAIVYTALTFGDTIGNIKDVVNNFEFLIEYGHFSYFIAPLDNIFFTFGVLLLAVLPLFKVRGFLLALPLGMFLIHANASFITLLVEIIQNFSQYGEEIIESNLSNIINSAASAAVLSFAIFLMIIAALMSSKKRKPVLAIIATVFFFINLVTYIINVVSNLMQYGAYGYTINATVIGFAFLHLLLAIAMLMLGLWMAHGKAPKAPKAKKAENAPITAAQATKTAPATTAAAAEATAVAATVVAEPAPVVEPEPVVEPAPVAEPELVAEPEPVAEPEFEENFDNAVDKLKRYKELLDIGAITEEEFNEKKKQLLGF